MVPFQTVKVYFLLYRFCNCSASVAALQHSNRLNSTQFELNCYSICAPFWQNRSATVMFCSIHATKTTGESRPQYCYVSTFFSTIIIISLLFPPVWTIKYVYIIIKTGILQFKRDGGWKQTISSVHFIQSFIQSVILVLFVACNCLFSAIHLNSSRN